MGKYEQNLNVAKKHKIQNSLIRRERSITVVLRGFSCACFFCGIVIKLIYGRKSKHRRVSGIDVKPVHVEVQISGGLPAFNIVGLPDKAVAESKERVRAALHALGLSLPPKRLTVNLAPADLMKEGSHFDLPIAVGLLAAMDVIPKRRADGVFGSRGIIVGCVHPSRCGGFARGNARQRE